jgi:hypothetical protein
MRSMHLLLVPASEVEEVTGVVKCCVSVVVLRVQISCEVVVLECVLRGKRQFTFVSNEVVD